MCTVLLPPGGYPIAVNKYITSSIMRRVGYLERMGERRTANREFG